MKCKVSESRLNISSLPRASAQQPLLPGDKEMIPHLFPPTADLRPPSMFSITGGPASTCHLRHSGLQHATQCRFQETQPTSLRMQQSGETQEVRFS